MFKAQNMDRGIRIMGGCVLIGLTVVGGNAIGPVGRIAVISVGIYGLVTGLTNFCPLFHFILREKKERRRKDSADKAVQTSDAMALHFFDGFSEKEVEKVISLSVLKEYDKNDVVVQEGKLSEMLCVIYSGQLKIEKSIDQGETKVIDTISDGDTFGEVSFFNRLPPSVSVICIEETKILEISEMDFAELIKSDPVLGLKILSRLMTITSARVRSLHDQIASLGHWVVQSRQQIRNSTRNA